MTKSIDGFTVKTGVYHKSSTLLIAYFTGNLLLIPQLDSYTAVPWYMMGLLPTLVYATASCVI